MSKGEQVYKMMRKAYWRRFKAPVGSGSRLGVPLRLRVPDAAKIQFPAELAARGPTEEEELETLRLRLEDAERRTQEYAARSYDQGAVICSVRGHVVFEGVCPRCNQDALTDVDFKVGA